MLGSGAVTVNVKWENRETVTAQANKGSDRTSQDKCTFLKVMNELASQPDLRVRCSLLKKEHALHHRARKIIHGFKSVCRLELCHSLYQPKRFHRLPSHCHRRVFCTGFSCVGGICVRVLCEYLCGFAEECLSQSWVT